MTRRPFPVAALLFALGAALPLAAQDVDEATEKAVAAATGKVAPSVVVIQTAGGLETVAGKDIFGKSKFITRGTGPTTGVVVGADGYVVTSSFNFANKPTDIFVTVPGKPRETATVVAMDSARMLTLLKIKSAGLVVPAAVPRGEVRSRLQAWLPQTQVAVRTFNAVLAAAQVDGTLGADDQAVWQTGFAPQPGDRQEAAVNTLLGRYAAAPYAPPNLQDSMQILAGDAELFAYLLERGLLVRLGDDVLLRRSDFEAMVARIREHLQAQGTITLAEVRDLFGTSRKYAQAVLEEMDARRITRREGEGRVLR